jgi:ribonuclease PH
MVDLQVLAAVFGPRTADNRGQAPHDRALVKCEYAEAAFSTGACPRLLC